MTEESDVEMSEVDSHTACTACTYNEQYDFLCVLRALYLCLAMEHSRFYFYMMYVYHQ